MEVPRPSPSVYGIETEYSALLTFLGNREYELAGVCHSADAALGLYDLPDTSGGEMFRHPSDVIRVDDSLRQAVEAQKIFINSIGMLSNGGRFYLDSGGFEYATPETTTAEEAVHRTFDGDRFLLHVLESLRKNQLLEGYQLNRRIIDHDRSSRGVHINTTLSTEKGDPSYHEYMVFATLNVVKGALFGSGGLLINKQGTTEYHHSPRLSVTKDLTEELFESKSLIRRPFKIDLGGYYRVETITSDALNFGWPLRASMVMTNAVTGLIEMGYIDALPLLHYSSAVQSAQNVGQNGPDAIIEIEAYVEPQTAKALDILKQYAEVVLAVDKAEDYLDPEARQVIPEIIEVADLAAKDTDLIVRDVESVARLAAMTRRMEETKSALDSERMCRFDYMWDKVGGGLAETLRRKGSVGWRGFSQTDPKPSVAKKRLVTPPQDTRARIRGAVIDIERGQDECTWDRISTSQVEVNLHPLNHDLKEFLDEHDL